MVSNHQQHAVWEQYYQYDRLDNITGIERSEGEKHYQQQFGYDLVQRLIRDQGPYGKQQFDYDTVGNRLSQTQMNAPNGEPQREEYHYAPASNRLLGTSDKTLLLDPAGNILQESNDTPSILEADQRPRTGHKKQKIRSRVTGSGLSNL